jgi:hypothetical protein
VLLFTATGCPNTACRLRAHTSPTEKMSASCFHIKSRDARKVFGDGGWAGGGFGWLLCTAVFTPEFYPGMDKIQWLMCPDPRRILMPEDNALMTLFSA